MKEKIYSVLRKIPFLKLIYKKITGTQSFTKPKYFLNNSQKSSTACFVLAGYKSYTWDIVFKRIAKFTPQNIDICIVGSGIYSEKLKCIAQDNKWSYVVIKRNCVTLALNSAINLFPYAENIYKLDEDIFITKNFFQNVKIAYEQATKDYIPGFAAPLIPINGFGYRKVLEKFGLVEEYTKRFEYPVISAGAEMHIENDPEVAKFFWNDIPHIDELNAHLTEFSFSVCPIRFSIGAIFFKRKMIEEVGYFPVRKGTCMGLDEVFLCNLATSDSKAIIVAENALVGHLSFGKQNEVMHEFYINNPNRFEIREV